MIDTAHATGNKFEYRIRNLCKLWQIPNLVLYLIWLQHSWNCFYWYCKLLAQLNSHICRPILLFVCIGWHKQFWKLIISAGHMCESCRGFSCVLNYNNVKMMFVHTYMLVWREAPYINRRKLKGMITSGLGDHVCQSFEHKKESTTSLNCSRYLGGFNEI